MAMMVVMAAAAVAGAVVAVAAVATTAVPAAMAAAAACVGGGGDGGDGSPQPPPIHQWALGAGAARGSPWRPLTLKLVWRRCDRPPRAADVPVAPHAAATSDAVMLAGRLPGEMASPWDRGKGMAFSDLKLLFPFHRRRHRPRSRRTPDLSSCGWAGATNVKPPLARGSRLIKLKGS